MRLGGNTDFYSQVDVDLFARNTPDEWRFNHSCEPNCKLVNQRTVSLRRICPGEELSYDYGLTENAYYFSFRCSCGAANCRKVITSWDYLSKKILSSGVESASEHAKQLHAGASLFEKLHFKGLRAGLLVRHSLLGSWSIPPAVRAAWNRYVDL